MRKAILSIAFVSALLTVSATDSTHAANVKSSVKEHRELIKKHIYSDFKQMYRQPTGIALIYPYLTPGSKQYANVLWDWDSWLSNVALRQTLTDVGTDSDRREALKSALSFHDLKHSSRTTTTTTVMPLRACTTGRTTWPSVSTTTHRHSSVRKARRPAST